MKTVDEILSQNTTFQRLPSMSSKTTPRLMTIGNTMVTLGSRRLNFQSHGSTPNSTSSTPSFNQSLNNVAEIPNLSESFSSTTISPLVTIIYSNVLQSAENQQMNMTSHSSSELGRRNSTTLSIATLRPIGTAADSRKHTIADVCTFVRFVHGDNQQILLNSYASCRRLLDHLKQVAGIHPDETVDVIDHDGKLKELSVHSDDYASHFLTARSTYYILKVEVDSTTGEKRYFPHFNLEQVDQKLNVILTNSLNTLNKATSKPKRPVAGGRQNSITQSSSNAPQNKGKRTATRK